MIIRTPDSGVIQHSVSSKLNFERTYNMNNIEVFYRTQGSRSKNCCEISVGATVADLKKTILAEEIKSRPEAVDIITDGDGNLFIEDGGKIEDDALISDLPSNKTVHLADVGNIKIKAGSQNDEVELTVHPSTTIGTLKIDVINALELDMNEHSEDDLCLRETGERLSANDHIGSFLERGAGKDEILLDLNEGTKPQG